MNCKMRDINKIFDWCEKYADEKAKTLIGTQPETLYLAHFTPSQANWSYQLGLVQIDNCFYEVVTVFGEVRAVRLANIPKYTQKSLEERRFK